MNKPLFVTALAALFSALAFGADLDQRVLQKVDRDHSNEVHSGHFAHTKAAVREHKASKESAVASNKESANMRQTQLAALASGGPGHDVPTAAKSVAKRPTAIVSAVVATKAKSGDSGGSSNSGHH